MDIFQKKKEWIQWQDDIFETEVRWEWLHNKIESKRIGTLSKKESSLHDIPNENISECNLSNSQKENNTTEEQKREESVLDVYPVVNYQETDTGLLVLDSLSKFVTNVLQAIKETSVETTFIKDLLWDKWNREASADTFYDGRKLARQLSDVLYDAWAITVSIYCFQVGDVARRGEKVVNLLSIAQNLVIQILKSAWQESSNNAEKDNLFKMDVEGRMRRHRVGLCYSRALADAHSLTSLLSEMIIKMSIPVFKMYNSEKELPAIFKLRCFENVDLNKYNCKMMSDGTNITSNETSSWKTVSENTEDPNSCQCSWCSNSKLPKGSHVTTSGYMKLFPAKFELVQWQLIIGVFEDMKMEWKNLGDTFKVEDLQNNVLKTNSERGQMEHLEELNQNFQQFISFCSDILNCIEIEMKEQEKIWQNRESKGISFCHVKGLDPNEALIQARSLQEQHSKVFFSLLFLFKSSPRRRVVNYATIICDCLANARSFCYDLFLSPEITFQSSSNEQLNIVMDAEICQDMNFISKSIKDYIVNPHKILQIHALALASAHSLCHILLDMVGTQ